MDDRQRRGTNNAGQSGGERKVKRVEMESRTMAVLRVTDVPRTWTGWGSTVWSKILSMHGVSEAHGKYP